MTKKQTISAIVSVLVIGGVAAGGNVVMLDKMGNRLITERQYQDAREILVEDYLNEDLNRIDLLYGNNTEMELYRAILYEEGIRGAYQRIENFSTEDDLVETLLKESKTFNEERKGIIDTKIEDTFNGE